MARAIWSGVISFGLVTIPVKLNKATSETRISFNLLHEKCRSKIEERRWCPHCEEEVPWDDLVRGFQFAKGQYVVLSEEDLEKLPLPSKKTVHVTAFVKSDEIDPMYYNESYYLEPDKGAQTSYALLLESLKKKGMVGLGKIALRSKERLCCVRPHGGILMVETLYYPNEIRVDESLSVAAGKPSRKEFDMAEKLIELMVDQFHPEEYHDEYREALEKVIESKLEDKEIAVQPEAGRAGKVVDLAGALEASLANLSSGSKSAREKRTGGGGKTSSRSRASRQAGGRTAKSKSTARKGKGEHAQKKKRAS